jgi:hypothetical protein
VSPGNLQAALVHSYSTVFLWSALIFVAGAVVAGLVLQRGDLTSLAREEAIALPDTETREAPRTHTCRLRIACR